MAIKFDPTVNLGHVLTFVGFMASGLIAYSALEKRVALVEEKTEAAVRLATERSQETKDSLREIKADIKELARDVGATLKNRDRQ